MKSLLAASSYFVNYTHTKALKTLRFRGLFLSKKQEKTNGKQQFKLNNFIR